MSSLRFEFGDQIRHPKRPEWGIGSVVRAADVAQGNQTGQRLGIRFPNAGLKTIMTTVVELERVEVAPAELDDSNEHKLSEWDRVQQSGWLGPVAERKIEEAMITLPLAARDPFNSMRDRLAFTLGLFRFDRTGRRLIDWATAQCGLEDPLNRFNRHELEQFFDRWAGERDQHLARLLREPEAALHITSLLDDAPPEARRAVGRLKSRRVEKVRRR